MDLKELERLLRAFKQGELDDAEAARRISNLHFEDLGHARVDHARAARQGFPEVVFGAGKTRAQVVEIVAALARRAPNVLVTRTDEGTFGEVRNVCTEAEWHPSARMIRVVRDRTERGAGGIMAERERLRAARVLVVAAGMEGALPSVVGGLVAAPVIAVPTSVGYGASFGGVAALLGMLNSCSSNVTVVNIDNGFGAGFVASLINRKQVMSDE